MDECISEAVGSDLQCKNSACASHIPFVSGFQLINRRSVTFHTEIIVIVMAETDNLNGYMLSIVKKSLEKKIRIQHISKLLINIVKYQHVPMRH